MLFVEGCSRGVAYLGPDKTAVTLTNVLVSHMHLNGLFLWKQLCWNREMLVKWP